jgi:hypothetical protein
MTLARYRNAPDALASRLGINPKSKLTTTFGGNTPQYLEREEFVGRKGRVRDLDGVNLFEPK